MTQSECDPISEELAKKGVWTAEFAIRHLGIKRERLWDWVRRSREDGGHQASMDPRSCPGCLTGKGFPHVDPPVRAAGLTAYVAEQLLNADQYTAESPRGGNLRRVLDT